MVLSKVPGAGRQLKRLWKWDGLSSDAQHTCKKSGMSMHACNLSRGKQVPGTHWPASLNSWIPDALRDAVSNESHKNYDGNDGDNEEDDGERCWNWPLHTHWCTFIHAHANTSMHTWISTSHCIPMKTLFPLLSTEKIHLELLSGHPLPSCKYSIFWYNLKRITFIFCSSLWLIAVATAKSTNLYQ